MARFLAKGKRGSRRPDYDGRADALRGRPDVDDDNRDVVWGASIETLLDQSVRDILRVRTT